MGNDKKVKNGPNKILALITYIIALIGLLLGLFLPFAGTEMKVEAMLGLQLPAALNAIYPLEFLKDIAAQYPLTQFSLQLAQWDAFTLDLGAIFVLLYGLVTLAGIFALIPAIINVASKKSNKNIALSAASFIEVCAIAVLATLLLSQLSLGVETMTCYVVMGAFGGVFLMLVVQAFAYKKGSGVIKLILALLSSAAVIFAVFDVVEIIPQLGELLAPVQQDWLALGFVNDGSAIKDVAELIKSLFNGSFALPEGAAAATLYLTTVIAGLLALINCVLDLMGLGKRTNKGMLITNIVRYALELAALICVIVCTFFIDGTTMGLFLLVLTALALISLIINIIRLVAYAKSKKRATATEVVAETSEDGEVKETKKERKQREKAERAAAKAAAAEQAKAEKEAAKAAKASAKEDDEPVTDDVADETAATAPTAVYVEDGKGNIVYTPVIYNGPVDNFIRTLNNEQRLEFSRVFLERQAGALTCIPTYVVGGKNEKFFSSVFIYYGRVRDLISDGLMNEIYKQANMM